MAFREHLCAHQYARVTAGRACERFVHRAFEPRTVAVYAGYRCIAVTCRQRAFYALRTLAERAAGAAAITAARVQRPVRAAMVAMQRIAGRMHGHSCIAAIALGDLAAAATDQGRCKAATVEKNQCLTFFREMLVERPQQWIGQSVVAGVAGKINESQQRWCGIACALRQ